MKHKKLALIVEDEHLIAIDLKNYLEEFGYDSILINSGEDAIRVAGKHSLDIVIMDIELNGKIDGCMAASKIVESNSEYAKKIIYLSGMSKKQILKHYPEYNSEHPFIEKVFNEQNVSNAIKELEKYN